jgi:hypothetical protein
MAISGGAFERELRKHYHANPSQVFSFEESESEGDMTPEKLP